MYNLDDIAVSKRRCTSDRTGCVRNAEARQQNEANDSLSGSINSIMWATVTLLLLGGLSGASSLATGCAFRPEVASYPAAMPPPASARKPAATSGRAAVASSSRQVRAAMSDGSTPVVVEVFAKFCGPCRMIEPHVEALAVKLGERARVIKLDSSIAPVLSSELNVQGLPTLLFLKEGKEVHRVVGAPPQHELEDLAREHLGIGI